MKKSKALRKLKKRVRRLEDELDDHKETTRRNYKDLHKLLIEFYDKLTILVNHLKKSENGIHAKKLEKKK